MKFKVQIKEKKHEMVEYNKYQKVTKYLLKGNTNNKNNWKRFQHIKCQMSKLPYNKSDIDNEL